MQKHHRIFIAINLPSDIKKVLSDYEKKWPSLPAKWTSAENLHITLVFLGDLTDTELGEVCVAVKETTKRYGSFEVKLNKISYGPNGKIPPRYIWSGGEASKEINLLKKDLEGAMLEKVNFITENKLFSPHVTLARINTIQWRAIEPEERPEVNENIDLIFTVESIEVMESELKRGGPQYTIIESHQLQ